MGDGATVSDAGTDLTAGNLYLVKGREFAWTYENLDNSGNPLDYPAGDLYFEIETDPVTTWHFTISGSMASIDVSASDTAPITPGLRWQLVFLPSGDTSGGEALAFGMVVVDE
jgi:hypothetical protein